MTDRLINHFPAPTHAQGPVYWVTVETVDRWLKGEITDGELGQHLKTAQEVAANASGLIRQADRLPTKRLGGMFGRIEGALR